MRTTEDIDREIEALLVTAKAKREKVHSTSAKKELDDCVAEIHKLKDYWEHEKEENQDLFEEERKSFEAEIYGLVERIKNAENDDYKHSTS